MADLPEKKFKMSIHQLRARLMLSTKEMQTEPSREQVDAAVRELMKTYPSSQDVAFGTVIIDLTPTVCLFVDEWD